MSARTSRETMEAYLAAVTGRGDFARFFAPDVLWTTMETGEQIHGRDSVRDLIVFIHTQAFDAKVQLGRLLVDDSGAAIEAVFAGRHIGDFAGVSPTGTEVRVPYAVSYDVAEGAITALRAYFPMTAVRERLAQAAAAPATV